MSDIRLTTSIHGLEQFFEQAAKIIYEEVQYNLNYLGNVCVRRIRDRSGDDSWYDQTGNLRSSIGYAIYSQGLIVSESAFETVLGGDIGRQAGREMVNELAKQYSDTYALVVVAAMEYADFVEAIETKDVLASTEIYAKNEVGKYLDNAIKKAERKIQQLEAKL